jgi:opacity protein-like surface antigen
MKVKTILMGLFLTTFIATPLMAEVREGAFTFALSEGGYTFDSKQDVKTNFSSGMKLGYNITGNWGLESSFSYVKMESKHSQENDKGELYNLNGNILYHFLPENRLVPFLALGGGWSRTTHLFGTPDNQDGTLNYGAGIKYFLCDTVALRADFRNIYSYHSGGSESYWSNYEYTAGLSFQFGGTKSSPVAVVTEKPVKMAMAPAEPAVEKQPIEPAVTAAKVVPSVVTQPPAEPVPALAAVPPVPIVTQQPPATPAPTPVAEESACDKSIAVLNVMILEDGVEIITDSPVDIFRTFSLSDPTRLAIDICSSTHITNGGRTLRYSVNKMGISTVRVGNHPGKLRIALDSPHAKFPAYKIIKTKSGLKVIFKKKK